MADEWPVFRQIRLAALREAPYAFSTTLEEWQGAGDSEERWRSRLHDVPYNVLAELDGVPAGMVSATTPSDEGATALISMWVAPFARGKGVGDALVAAVVDWARSRGLSRIELDVREANEQAFVLYTRHGFVDEGAIHGSLSEPPERRMALTLRR